MRFTFEQVEILKYILEKPDKAMLLSQLENFESNEIMPNLIPDLIDVVLKLSQKDIERLYKDRIEYKIGVYLFYELKT